MRYEQHIDLQAAGAIARFSPDYRRKKAEASRYILRAFDKSPDKASVSISGGKDSIAMLALVAEAAAKYGREIVAWAHISDASFPGTLETCQQACELAKVTLFVDYSPVSAFDVVGQQSSVHFGKKGYFFSAIERLIKSGYGLSFVGVRAAESKRRMQACRAHGPVFTSTIPAAHWKCHPLQNFSISDVAACLAEYEMPIHPIYEKMAIGTLPIRLGYATALDLLDKGTVIFMRRNYPELYRKLLIAYPSAGDFK